MKGSQVRTPKAPRRLLSVDWDFFTVAEGSQLDKDHPFLMDWGHNEGYGPGLDNFLWASRAAGFKRRGLPLTGTSGQEVGFWDRVRLHPKARVFLMESHKEAVHPALFQFGKYAEVWNFDAHHDAGYKREALTRLQEKGAVDCGSWMLAYHEYRGTKLVVRYPQWKVDALRMEGATLVPMDRAYDHGGLYGETFHDVVIARSGAWTPPWLDAQFEAFVQACPLRCLGVLKPDGDIERDGQLAPRTLDEEVVTQCLAEMGSLGSSPQVVDR